VGTSICIIFEFEFHKKLKGDVQLHKNSTEFHKKLKGAKMEDI